MVAERERGDRPGVLVTGAGSSLGVSVLKALRHSKLDPWIVATDAQPMSSGLFRADVSYVVPWVRDTDAYLERVAEICRSEQLPLVLLGSEVEVRGMVARRDELEAASGARVVVNDAAMVDAFLDKLSMVRMLQRQGLPVPDSARADVDEESEAFLSRHDPPFVLKGRRSSGSKHVHVIRDRAELPYLVEHTPLPMLQEYLWPDDQEYTVGVYKSPTHGYVGHLALRRTLGAGLTYKAEVVRDDEIEQLCRQVVEAFEIWGPANLQLRRTADGPRVFEINLRFSTSEVMRAHFGFNAPELCIRDLVLGERPATPRIREGYALRYWDELYLEPDEYAPVPGGRRRGRAGTLDDVF